MTLRLYDTGTRSVRDFVPRVAGHVGIYLCGLTVQAGPHIGHLRSAVNYDVLRRWLLESGYSVLFIRNITDIDDRLLVKSVETEQPFWSIAYANELVLADVYRRLGVLAPTYEPRATGHVPEIIELIEQLIQDGHAYAAKDESGDVYFDVRSYAQYGDLSGRILDEMESASDAPERAKRDPRDFALWKGEKVGEPADAYWPSPWGRGRPGWHIECSAMCRRYLGAEFDIHGGGADLIFPHHENEIAQSRAAGFGFANYWVHHALLNLGASKMSKSIGNVLDLDSIVASGIRPVELRYYLMAPHYRSTIDFSEAALREAAVAYQRIERFIVHAEARADGNYTSELPAEFVDAMNDDLNTPRAVAIVHDAVTAGNGLLAEDGAVAATLGSVRAMLATLGIDPLTSPWTNRPTNDLAPVVDALTEIVLEYRNHARDRQDWPVADSIRDRLRKAGLMVEDTAGGSRWELDRSL